LPAKVKFYGFQGSNSVYTGKLMLEHKGIDYKPVMLMPGAHAFMMLGLGFETMGVPALKIDGRRVQGTRAISRDLDDLVAEKPLFPADPARRKAVQDAERWGEELQNATRRLFYCAGRRDHDVFRSVMSPARSLPMRGALWVATPLIIRLATGAHRASDAAGCEDLELMPERLDQIDAWIAEGVLGGEELNAADFQIAVNVSALMLFDQLRPFIENRPAAALGQRVAPDYVGHVSSVLPDQWLAPLREDAASKAAGGATAAVPPRTAAVPVA
jgi:glutathione S-transferase